MNEKSPIFPTSPSPNGSRGSIRRRKPGKTIFVAQPAPTRRLFGRKPANGNIPGNISPLIEVDSERIKGAFKEGASNSYHYALDVLGTSFWLLKRPLALFVFLCILGLLFNRLSRLLKPVLAPVCWIPGISSSALCRFPDSRNLPKWADYSKLMDVESSTFEQLLDESVGGSGLSLEIKKAEMATSDLVTLVKYSNLKSRDLLAKSLEDFVSDARKSGKGLQKLSSKIGGAVDSILAVNDHALHTIEAYTAKPKGVYGVIVSALTSEQKTKEIVTKTFQDAMAVLSTQMERIIMEAEVSLINLDRLEQRMQTLHELVHREDNTLQIEKAELLAQLWTILGGNRRQLRGVEGHLYLLKNLGQYRKRALAHVSAALHTLQGMQEDMEDLRERVAAPELTGDRVPLEVHMKSIKMGLDRITEQRDRAQIRQEETVRRLLGPNDD
ncbi:hypothetical protein C8Q75DRAFT_717561 [Abortiporus biennis]|nr:hypothetical protein C8Q75DRAFT_717561 [Abortiporus biennis]